MGNPVRFRESKSGVKVQVPSHFPVSDYLLMHFMGT